MAQSSPAHESYPGIVWRIAELDMKIRYLQDELDMLHRDYCIPRFSTTPQLTRKPSAPKRTRDTSMAERPSTPSGLSAMDWENERGSPVMSDYTYESGYSSDELPQLVDVYNCLPILSAPRNINEIYNLDTYECKRILKSLGQHHVNGDIGYLRRTLHSAINKLGYARSL